MDRMGFSPERDDPWEEERSPDEDLSLDRCARLSSIRIRREQSRSLDQRRQDRRDAHIEPARIHADGVYDVQLINVSTSGLMIAAPGVILHIGQELEIELGGCDPALCFVRWIRGDRMGLEFSDETNVIAPSSVKQLILRNLRAEQGPASGGPAQARSDRTGRQRLRWSALICYDDETATAQVRNISAEGALVECEWDFYVGTPLVLALDRVGSVGAIVRWCRGGQLGLKFLGTFDMQRLAVSRCTAVEKARAAAAAHLPAPSIRFGSGGERRFDG
jgi:hypothetical protein